MADRLRNLTQAELERALVEVGQQLEYPDVQVATAVVARLRAEAPVRRPRWSRRVALVVALFVGLLAGTAAAAGFGVPGIALRFEASDAPASEALVTDERFLGRRVSLDEASELAAFDVAAPTVDGLPEPEVYVGDQPAGGRVSLVYPDLVITQFRATIGDEFMLKYPDAAQPVTVAGSAGWWIEGGHEIAYVGGDGQEFSETPRTADSVLIWTRGSITLRLETDLSRERAIQIAASMR